jgi:hypothetical protein
MSLITLQEIVYRMNCRHFIDLVKEVDMYYREDKLRKELYEYFKNALL